METAVAIEAMTIIRAMIYVFAFVAIVALGRWWRQRREKERAANARVLHQHTN